MIKKILDRLIPRTTLGSGLAALVVMTLLALAGVVLGTKFLKSYGIALFVMGPISLGYIVTVLNTYHEPKSLGNCVALACITILALAGMLMIVALEGFICILMALPLALPLAILGVLLAYFLQWLFKSKEQTVKSILILILLMPLLMGAEYAVKWEPMILPVTSYVDINAPVDVVWKNVIAFPALPEPKGILFNSGLAYPKYASIKGKGVGAVRECHFSTGPFIEPVTVWDENKLLRFNVTSQPEPMKELSPYKNIHPAHMDNYLQSKQGQFLLTQMPDGKVRLEGTTWYSNKMWPESYWRMWSDYIIHEIHLRVLEHIKNIAEERAG